MQQKLEETALLFLYDVKSGHFISFFFNRRQLFFYSDKFSIILKNPLKSAFLSSII